MKKSLAAFVGVLAILGLQGLDRSKPGSCPRIHQAAQGSLPSSVKVNPDFGKMPVYFIPNRGQMDDQVDYYVQGKDKTIYFTDEGITFALAKAKEKSAAPNNTSSALRPRGKDETSLMRLHSWEEKEWPYKNPAQIEKESGLERWVVKLDFVGANPGSHPEGLDETGTKISYFKGRQEEWKAGLPAYSKVIYRDLWPGIDLVYYGTVNRLKYEFIIHPGADPSQIRLSYRGAESVSADEAGRLQVITPMGGFSDDAPVAYQEIDGKRTNVNLAYRVDGESLSKRGKQSNTRPEEVGADNGNSRTRSCSYRFEIGDYDRSQRLVLDPAIIIYCGYIGGSDNEGASGIALDSSGNIYVSGSTISGEATFPVAVGPDLSPNGNSEAFVAKVNTSGTALIYCGYIGGSRDDYGLGIAVDSSECAYVMGYTQSSEATFPVTAGPDLTYNGNYDAFVTKINPSGTALVYCGYVGGVSWDYGYDIAVDSFGCAYVMGYTQSSEATFPVTAGPDLTHNGNFDAFVTKINPSGTALVYCGYIGGVGWDYGYGIAVDSFGCAYVTGETSSTETTFPVNLGPDLTHNGGKSYPPYDVFVAKLNASGTVIVYCGYIGGYGYDCGKGIAVDAAGCAYVTGITSSAEATFPVAVGPDMTYNGGPDSFVAKVNASGSSLVYCGYIGGSDEDHGWGIAVDSAGCAYLTGKSFSTEATFPTTAGPDITFNGQGDSFVAKVNASGTTLAYCSYIGGSVSDIGYAISADRFGNAYVAGSTFSTEASFPVTVGPDLTFNGGNPIGDAFVAKISPEYFGYYIYDNHDFDGDGDSDIAVFRPSDGVWYIRGIDNDRWGQVNDIPVPGDYDGDGITDIAVWRPSDGVWYLRGIDEDQWGQVGDVPVPADYDGDGRTDLAVWRPSDGIWYVRGIDEDQWGQTGDFPVPGDYDGDGKAEMAVWRPSEGTWYIKGVDTDYLGQDGDIPVPADYDGDGKTDLAVWRPSDGTWHIRYRKGGGKIKPWGMPGDVPAPGDYNGDGIADLAVWRPSTGQWLIKNIDTDVWGTAGDIPLVR